MSTIDLKIQNVCDHMIVGERQTLQKDRCTILPEFPIAATGALTLTRFDMLVPEAHYCFRQDKQLLYQNKYLKIVRNSMDRYQDAVYELSYPTYLVYCPKCLGSGYMDDLAEDITRNVTTVSGVELLVQSVEKAIVTSVGSNKYCTWFGSGVPKVVGSKISDINVLISEMETQVRVSLSNLRDVQVKHQALNPQVSGDEVLDHVTKISVIQDAQDPTVLFVHVGYTSQSGKSLKYTQAVELTQFRKR